uniref:Alternative protein GPR68 n=1 Tax=Homo sapiens TaxID=9606 RepID=L0R5B2_HUMAN|nr:alternative protein GPR68 [Homo sapiens]
MWPGWGCWSGEDSELRSLACFLQSLCMGSVRTWRVGGWAFSCQGLPMPPLSQTMPVQTSRWDQHCSPPTTGWEGKTGGGRKAGGGRKKEGEGKKEGGRKGGRGEGREEERRKVGGVGLGELREL